MQNKGSLDVMYSAKDKTDKLKSESGFSLIELLVVIAIMGIVIAISVPELRTWSSNANFKADARKLLGALQHARMEAVKRNSYCTVTFDQPVDGVTYDYVVFVDADNDRVLDTAEKPNILYRGEYDTAFKDPDSGMTPAEPVSFSANAAGIRAAIFNSRGLPLDKIGGSGGIIGSVRLKGPTGIKRSIAVSFSGRIRMSIP